MSQSWYAKHNGTIIGPITSAQLKQLVGTAKVKPATEVRLGDDGQWIQASRVKGLIQKTNQQPQQPSHQQARSTNLKPSHAKNSGTKRRVQQEAVNPYQSPAFDEGERPKTQGLKKTRAGLFTVYYGICAVLFAMGGGSLLGILGTSTGMPVPLILAGVLAIVAGLGGYIAILVGQVLCLTVPRESGGKGHVQIAAVMQALSILLAIGGQVMTTMMMASGSVDPILLVIGSNAVSFLNCVLGLVGYICFLYFIKNLSLYIGRQDLASSSSTVMKMVIFVAVLLLAFPVMAVMAVFSGAAAGMGLLVFGMVITAIAFLITFIRYANLVGYLARAIPK